MQTPFLTNQLGRKPLLYSCIVIFLVGFPGSNVLPRSLMTIVPDRISALRGCAKHDLVNHLQSVSGGWRWWYHATLNDHHFRYRPVERVRIVGAFPV